jgi:hypothetical protein
MQKLPILSTGFHEEKNIHFPAESNGTTCKNKGNTF